MLAMGVPLGRMAAGDAADPAWRSTDGQTCATVSGEWYEMY